MNVDYSQFALATAKREEKEILELQSKYEAVVDAYNKEVKRRVELENKLLGKSTRPKITYPRPPVEPFKSTPSLKYQTHPKGHNITLLRILKKKRVNCGPYM